MAKRKSYYYRKLYENYYGVTIQEGNDIHHIDLNPENDNPRNLMEIDKKTHNLYHQSLKAMTSVSDDLIDNIASAELRLNDLKNMCLAYEGMIKWFEYKQMLDIKKMCDIQR